MEHYFDGGGYRREIGGKGKSSLVLWTHKLLSKNVNSNWGGKFLNKSSFVLFSYEGNLIKKKNIKNSVNVSDRTNLKESVLKKKEFENTSLKNVL
jgi:hypothetical protein